MSTFSPYYRFGTDLNCSVNGFCINWKPFPGTDGQLTIPEPGTIEFHFHEAGRGVRSWPQIISGFGNCFPILLFAPSLVEQCIELGLTGVEFYPARLRLETIRGLRGKEALCPSYAWTRVTGRLSIEPHLQGRKASTDPTGMVVREKLPPGEIWKVKVKDEQPAAGDFCRILPMIHLPPVVSQRVIDLFVKNKVKEAKYTPERNGWL